jgi:prepilin-type processing-associated H-X9-DG protein
VKRAASTIAFMDIAQASGAGTAGGWISYTEGGALDAPADADRILDQYAGWSAQITGPTPDSGAYVPRYRHGGGRSTNVLWADGHVTGEARNALLYRNMSQSY